MVLLPASTTQLDQPRPHVMHVFFLPLPTTAILVSITSSTVSGFCRSSNFAVQPFSFSFLTSASSGPPVLRVKSMRHSVRRIFEARRILSNATSHCSLLNCIDSPLSSCPRSNKASPWPSSSLFCTTLLNCCRVTSASSPVSSRMCFNLTGAGLSDRFKVSRISSSACSSVATLCVA